MIESELVTVVARVLVSLLEHILDVVAGLGERDVVEAQARAAPGGDVRLAGVVGGQRRDLVVAELLDQVVEIEGAVADVDVGVGEIIELERLSPAQALDHLCRARRDLHQSASACV